jgi:hypothetical protein
VNMNFHLKRRAVGNSRHLNVMLPSQSSVNSLLMLCFGRFAEGLICADYLLPETDVEHCKTIKLFTCELKIN